MPDWECALFQVELPVGMIPVAMPAGWEPFFIAERQGNRASVIVKRVVGNVPPPSDDAPVIDSLVPDTLQAGTVPLSIDVYGSGFDSSCTIEANGQQRATFFLDTTHLQYTARPDLMSPGPVSITVVGSTGTSNAVTFTYT